MHSSSDVSYTYSLDSSAIYFLLYMYSSHKEVDYSLRLIWSLIKEPITCGIDYTVGISKTNAHFPWTGSVLGILLFIIGAERASHLTAESTKVAGCTIHDNAEGGATQDWPHNSNVIRALLRGPSFLYPSILTNIDHQWSNRQSRSMHWSCMTAREFQPLLHVLSEHLGRLSSRTCPEESDSVVWKSALTCAVGQLSMVCLSMQNTIIWYCLFSYRFTTVTCR